MKVTREDWIALWGLTKARVAAAAEHRHMPGLAAVTLRNTPVLRWAGSRQIKAMIVGDLRAALRQQNREHVQALLTALHAFAAEHRQELDARSRTRLA